MKVAEIMTQNVLTIHPGTTVLEAARKMKRAEVGALPVCEGGQLVGIVTDRDVVVRGIAAGLKIEDEIVSNIMSIPVVSVSPDLPVEAAARIMRERNIRKLVVLDEQRGLYGEVVGILTARDMAAGKPRELEQELSQSERELEKNPAEEAIQEEGKKVA